jgi:hypothetical protein
MGKMPPVESGREWERCHLCSEEENGEDATCGERKTMGKMPPVQGGREWGRCHLCMQEEPCTSEVQVKAKMESKY